MFDSTANGYWQIACSAVGVAIFLLGFFKVAVGVLKNWTFFAGIASLAIFALAWPKTSLTIQAVTLLLFLGFCGSFSNEVLLHWRYSSEKEERWSVRRWISSSFAHLGLFHLCVNLAALHSLYPGMLGLFGDLNLGLITVVLIVVICFSRSWVHQHFSFRPASSIGSSTWIFGWLGILATHMPHAKLLLLYAYPVPMISGLVSILVGSMFLSKIDKSGNVDHAGHAWGIFWGLLLGFGIQYFR